MSTIIGKLAEVVINLQRKKRNFAHSVNSKPVHQEKNIVFSGLLDSHFLFVYHIDKRKITQEIWFLLITHYKWWNVQTASASSSNTGIKRIHVYHKLLYLNMSPKRNTLLCYNQTISRRYCALSVDRRSHMYTCMQVAEYM